MNAPDRTYPRVERADVLGRSLTAMAAQPHLAKLAATPKPVPTSARQTRREVQRSRGMQ